MLVVVLPYLVLEGMKASLQSIRKEEEAHLLLMFPSTLTL